jgi:hypothetical protein
MVLPFKKWRNVEEVKGWCRPGVRASFRGGFASLRCVSEVIRWRWVDFKISPKEEKQPDRRQSISESATIKRLKAFTIAPWTD